MWPAAQHALKLACEGSLFPIDPALHEKPHEQLRVLRSLDVRCVHSTYLPYCSGAMSTFGLKAVLSNTRSLGERQMGRSKRQDLEHTKTGRCSGRSLSLLKEELGFISSKTSLLQQKHLKGLHLGLRGLILVPGLP